MSVLDLKFIELVLETDDILNNKPILSQSRVLSLDFASSTL